MTDYSISVDLLKIRGAFVANIQGRTTKKRCICIPFDDGGVFVGEKGVYLGMNAWEINKPKYGDTHGVKVELSKEARETMSEEELRNQPFVGHMKPIERKQLQMDVTANMTAAQDDDDLPF